MATLAAMPRAIRLLVIHCSASPNDRTLFSGKPGTPGFRTPVDEIDAWHKQSGFHRESYWRGRQNASLQAIGYHDVIARNGALFTGRHDDEPGAHVEGWNSASLGVCLVGTDQFTPEQWEMLARVVTLLAKRYDLPLAPAKLVINDGKRYVYKPGICGHREIPDVAKACPGFSVADWLAGGLQPLKGHLA